MEIHGTVGLAENQRACAPLQRRLLGFRRFAWMPLIVVLLLLQTTAYWLGDLVFPGVGLIALILISVAVWSFYLRYMRGVITASWKRRGVPLSQAVTYAVTSDALVIETDAAEIRLRWPALNELARGRDAWLFIGSGAAYFIPTRLFLDPSQERAFLEACLGFMTPEARARSKDLPANLRA